MLVTTLLVVLTLVVVYAVTGISIASYYRQGRALQDKKVSDFNQIEMKGVGRLVITQAAEENLQVEVSDRYRPHLRSEVQDDTLALGQKVGWLYLAFGPLLPRPTYYVSVNKLKGLSSSGVSKIQIHGLSSPGLRIANSGSGTIDAEQLSIGQLKVDISGNLKAIFRGSAKKQDIKTSGTSKYDALKLKTRATTVQISGSAHVNVFATDLLDVNISGSGKVRYKGLPQITQKISGSGNLAGAE